MNYFKIILSLLLFAISAQAGNNLKIVILSDTHLMEPSLLRQEGKAYDDYVAHDRKMLTLSGDLMEQATQDILRLRPNCLLIAGDLTKDGETVSHLYLRDKFLKRIRQAGIEVYVIPGNHDVNNPHAVIFDGDSTTRVPSPNAKEFADIYHDYGYGNTLARDSHSLSYVTRLDENTRLLCLDACEYEENDFDKNTCETGGRLKPETMAFVKEQVADARKSGKRLLAMMHHGVVEHWKWQGKAMREYLVEDWKKVCRQFRKLGIEIVFTGHFHAQDIAKRGELYDIETGSLISYPSPYRVVTLTDNTLTVETRHLSSEGLRLPEGESLQAYGKGFARMGIHTIVGDMLPETFDKELKNEVCDLIAEAYISHLEGDEQMPAEAKERIKAVAAKVRKKSWKYAYIFRHITKNLWTDLAPQDNHITINLNK